MKTSTEIGSVSKHIGYEAAVECVAKAGFDAFDLSMFDMARFNWSTQSVMDIDTPFRTSEYLKFVRRLKRIGEDNGIVCNQSHAPFPSHIPEISSYFKRAIECTAEAGGKICVIHPVNDYSAEQNAEFYAELLPFAKDCGVKIATENMYNWDGELNQATAAACSSHQDFLAHIKAIDDPYLVACVDIGHCEMRGLNTSAEQTLLTLGDYVQALHLHDNDRHKDSHQLPFTMDINFDTVVKALKKIGYSGWFTLEADAYLNGFSKEDLPRGVSDMAKAAAKLEQMFLSAEA